MAEMWRTKSCIIEMFLAFYETHHRPESSYRDFLQEVLSVYEEWKNARVPLDHFKRFGEPTNADVGGWYNVMPNVGDNYAEEEMQSMMKTEPVDEPPHPADKENETNPFLYGLPDSESCSSSSSSVAESDSTSGLQDDPSYVSRVDPAPVNLLSRRRWKRTDVMSCSEGSHKCPTCHRRFRSLGMLERHKVRHLAAAAVVEGSLGLRCSECQIVLPTRSCFIRHCLQNHSALTADKKDDKEGAGHAAAASISDAGTPDKEEKDRHESETAAVDGGNKMETDDAEEKVKVETEEDDDEEEGEAKSQSKEIPSQSEVVFPGLLRPETTPVSTSALKMEVASTPVLTAQSDLPSSSSGDIHCAEVPSNVLTNSLQHNLPPVLASAYQMPSGPSRRCPVCGKGISNKNNWERHLLIHTGVKPFKCRFCGKAFNRKDNLATHEKKHTKHMQQQMQLQQLHQQHILQQQSQPQETPPPPPQQQQQSQSSPNLYRHQEPQQQQQPQQQPQSLSPKKSSERAELKEQEQQQEEEQQKQHHHHRHQPPQQAEEGEKQHHHLHHPQQQEQSVSSFYQSPQQGAADSQQQRHQHSTNFHQHQQQQIASSTFQHHHYQQQPAVPNFIQHQETHKGQSMTPHHPPPKEVPQHQHTHSHQPRHIQPPLPPPTTHNIPQQHVHPQHQHPHHHHHHHHHPAHQNQHPHTHAQQHQICGRL